MMALTSFAAATIGIGPSITTDYERHELVVTYEGPFHPSVRSSPSSLSTPSNSRKTFCITLPPSDTSSRHGSSYVSNDDFLRCLSRKVGWPSYLLCIKNRGYHGKDGEDDFQGKLFPTHSFQSNDAANTSIRTITHHQHPPLTLTIHPRHSSLLGGKGGFGTLLKGQSKQAGARTTLDFGACRDLSGRRLRHVNDEIKLRKWRELQAQRERAAKSGGKESVDEMSALKTPSGIRNWHLMVPSWSEGAAFSNKGKRKIERQLQKEVRGWQSKEERARSARDEKRLEEEWAVMEYVRRGEEEGKRVVGQDVKDGILAHLRKRKQEKAALGDANKKDASSVAKSGDKSSFLDKAAEENMLASSHLMTLSGEISVLDVPNKKTATSKSMRIKSQSDFATVVTLLNADKLRNLSSKKQGVYMEYTIQSAGLAQIGWIRSPDAGGDADGSKAMFLPNSDTGDGVGDDSASFGFDGSRGLKFHDGSEVPYGGVKNGEEGDKNKPMEWKAGDVVGCWCKYVATDNNKNQKSSMVEIGYALNGIDFGAAFNVPAPGDFFGYYPAVSLNLNEVVDVNVGPEFAFDVKDACVGTHELVRLESDGNCDLEKDVDKNAASKADEVSSKLGEFKDSTEDSDKAPPRKRPREEPTTNLRSANDKKEDQATVEKESLDLNMCSSVTELKDMGPDRLKNTLLSMGVKCGGTTEERAKRLFSLKGIRREEYPNKVRGKNFIP